jgi:hypothetical protein
VELVRQETRNTLKVSELLALASLVGHPRSPVLSTAALNALATRLNQGLNQPHGT